MHLRSLRYLWDFLFSYRILNVDKKNVVSALVHNKEKGRVCE